MKKSLALLVPAALAVLLASCSSDQNGSPFQNMLGSSSQTSTPGVKTPEGERFQNTLVDAGGKPVNTEVGTAAGGSIGGDIASSMNNSDRQNMSRALDKGLGKSTSWMNYANNVNYTVVPIAKVSIKDNNFCRKYSLTATRGDKAKSYNGVACVSADGSWQAIRS